MAAFINASLNIPSDPDRSFILREYKDPNAFRRGEKENEESSAEESTEDSRERATAGNDGDNSSRKDHGHNANTESTSPSTEEVLRTDDPFHALQADAMPMNPLSPVDNNSINNNTPTSGLLGGNFIDFDAPSENLWEFWDLSSDNWGELPAGRPSDHFN